MTLHFPSACTRLEESVSRNQRLQEELTGVRREVAVLSQRREEDALVMSSQGYAKSAPKREKLVPHATHACAFLLCTIYLVKLIWMH